MTVDPALVLRVFQREIAQQCGYALRAFAEIDSSLTRQDDRAAWYAVQSFLIATANVSKLLWPPRPSELPDLRMKLRDSLEIKDDSPLASRDFRNHFEHFDERLESWARSTTGSQFIDRIIGRAGLSKALAGGDWFRQLNRVEWILSFQEHNYPLLPVVEALVALKGRSCLGFGGKGKRAHSSG